MTCINLIPAYRIDAWRQRMRVRRWIAGSSIYALIALIAAMTAAALMNQNDRDLTQDIAFTQGKVQSTGSALAALLPELTESKATLDASKAVTRQPDWSLLLTMLAEIRGEKVLLREVELQPISMGESSVTNYPGDQSILAHPPGYVVTVEGLGLSQIDISQFVLRMEQTNVFNRVTVLITRREPFHNVDAVAFELECLLRGDEDKKP